MRKSGVRFQVCCCVFVLFLSACMPEVAKDVQSAVASKSDAATRGEAKNTAVLPDENAGPRTLKVRIKADRYIDTTETIDVRADADVFGQQLKIPRLIIDEETQGLAEVFVWTDREVPAIADKDREPVTHEMKFENGNFSPRSLVMEAGDALLLVGHPSVPTNPNTGFLWRGRFGLLFGPRARLEEIPEEHSYDRFSPITCSIHPWMRANVFVANRKYCRLTNELGECELPLPADATQAIDLDLMHPGLKELPQVTNGDSAAFQVLRPGLLRVWPGVNEIEIILKVE